MGVFRRPAQADVHRLLVAAQLPTDDLTPQHLENFFGCGPPERPLGVGGIELHGKHALLRSLAVDAAVHGQGHGTALVAALEAHARAHGAQRIYLLTTTAARYFEGLGYRVATRDEAPASIRTTSEFSALCPASAVFMTKDLR